MSNIETDLRGFASPDDEIAALLPFYLNGGLSAADTARVEAWLARDERAGAALRTLEQERGEIIAVNEDIAVKGGALGRLMDAIDAEPVPVRHAVAARGRGFLAGLMERFDAVPARLAWAACALLLAVVIGQGAMLSRSGETPGFEVASGGQHGSETGPVALVGFAGNATSQAITDALTDAEASIVAGPKGAGVYEVRFSDDQALSPVKQRIAVLTARKDVISYIAVQSGGQ